MWHIVGPQPILLLPPPIPSREESRLVNGPGRYRGVETPSIPELPPPPGPLLSPPICCPRCIPIRRISQPGGSGYRRLNDKVPPLPARPASPAAGTRSGFSTLPPRPRKKLGPPRCAEPARRQQPRREAEARAAGAASGRLCAGSTFPSPQALRAQLPSSLASSLLGVGGHSPQPGSGAHALAAPGAALLPPPAPPPRSRSISNPPR